MNDSAEMIAALTPVNSALRRLNVPYYVGGSVASSYHGATRSTMDVDLVCDLSVEHVEPLIQLLGDEYYLSASAMHRAVQRKSCFNLIHLATSFKVDVFVFRGRDFDADCMRRAVRGRLSEAELLEVPIASAEDSIIAKLEWYQVSRESSQRQWEDVSRIIDLLGSDADVGYMQRAARSVGVERLFERLLTEKLKRLTP